MKRKIKTENQIDYFIFVSLCRKLSGILVIIVNVINRVHSWIERHRNWFTKREHPQSLHRDSQHFLLQPSPPYHLIGDYLSPIPSFSNSRCICIFSDSRCNAWLVLTDTNVGKTLSAGKLSEKPLDVNLHPLKWVVSKMKSCEKSFTF